MFKSYISLIRLTIDFYQGHEGSNKIPIGIPCPFSCYDSVSCMYCQRIVYAYLFLRRFDIFDFDGNIIKSVEVEPNSNAAQKFRGDGGLDGAKTVMCYTEVVSKGNSFFLNYIGHSPEGFETKAELSNAFTRPINSAAFMNKLRKDIKRLIISKANGDFLMNYLD